MSLSDVSWPRSEAPAFTGDAGASDAPPPFSPATARLGLVVVEDDEGDAVYLNVCLEEAGVPADSVRWFRTLRAAKESLAARPAECVLVDLGLPDASGMESVQGAVEAAPDAAVIVLTGLHDLRGEQALAAGAQDYLVKDSLNADLLSRCIRYAVERKRAQRTSRQLDEVRLRSRENARLERGLLPRPILSRGPIVHAARYQPGQGHAVLGGDFYDVVERSDGSVRVVIGDVMGHGPDEAAVGVHLRVAWRSLVLAGLPDADILPTLHRLLLAEQLPAGTFATACDLTIAGGLNAVVVRSAGHPAPLLATGGRVGYLDVTQAPPLGVGHGTYPAVAAPLEPGWKLMMFTDGLLDAFRDHADRDDIGLDGLAAAAEATERPEPRGWIDDTVARALQAVSDDLAAVVLAHRPATA